MSEEKYKQLIVSLTSGEKEMILKALHELRKSGRTDIFPHLFDLLRSNSDTEIVSVITDLLNDTKEEKVIPHFVDAIVDKRNELQLPTIVSACWQSGLNYCKYIDAFVPLMAHNNPKVAIEAYSVFEGHTEELNSEKRQELVAALKKLISNAPKFQQELIIELIHTIN